MAAKPTAVQEAAIREAIDNNRIGDATAYTDRTLATMARNRWITRCGDTYRITPEAAFSLRLFSLYDRYRNEDLLATDPKAQRQAAVVDQARSVGIRADVQIGSVGLVIISVDDFAALLATFQPAAAT